HGPLQPDLGAFDESALDGGGRATRRVGGAGRRLLTRHSGAAGVPSRSAPASPPAQHVARPPEVARVLRNVTAMARRPGMFEAGGRVVVACSGGPDSSCLVHAMVRLRR